MMGDWVALALFAYCCSGCDVGIQGYSRGVYSGTVVKKQRCAAMSVTPSQTSCFAFWHSEALRLPPTPHAHQPCTPDPAAMSA